MFADCTTVEDQARFFLVLLPRACEHARTVADAEYLEQTLMRAKWQLERRQMHTLVAELEQAISMLEIVKMLCDPVPAPRLL